MLGDDFGPQNVKAERTAGEAAVASVVSSRAGFAAADGGPLAVFERDPVRFFDRSCARTVSALAADAEVEHLRRRRDLGDRCGKHRYHQRQIERGAPTLVADAHAFGHAGAAFLRDLHRHRQPGVLQVVGEFVDRQESVSTPPLRMRPSSWCSIAGIRNVTMLHLIREDEPARRALARDDSAGVVADVLDVVAARRLFFDDVVERGARRAAASGSVCSAGTRNDTSTCVGASTDVSHARERAVDLIDHVPSMPRYRAMRQPRTGAIKGHDRLPFRATRAARTRCPFGQPNASPMSAPGVTRDCPRGPQDASNVSPEEELCRPICHPASTWRRFPPVRSRSRESALQSPPSSDSPRRDPPTNRRSSPTGRNTPRRSATSSKARSSRTRCTATS